MKLGLEVAAKLAQPERALGCTWARLRGSACHGPSAHGSPPPPTLLGPGLVWLGEATRWVVVQSWAQDLGGCLA